MAQQQFMAKSSFILSCLYLFLETALNQKAFRNFLSGGYLRTPFSAQDNTRLKNGWSCCALRSATRSIRNFSFLVEGLTFFASFLCQDKKEEAGHNAPPRQNFTPKQIGAVQKWRNSNSWLNLLLSCLVFIFS